MIGEVSASHKTAEIFRQIDQALTGAVKSKASPQPAAAFALEDRETQRLKFVGSNSSCSVSEAQLQKPCRESPAPVAPASLAASEPSKAAPAAPVETGRTPFPSDGLGAPIVSPPIAPRAPTPAPTAVDTRRSEAYYETKTTIFGALIEAIDLAQLARLDVDSARARKSATSSTRLSRSKTS